MLVVKPPPNRQRAERLRRSGTNYVAIELVVRGWRGEIVLVDQGKRGAHFRQVGEVRPDAAIIGRCRYRQIAPGMAYSKA